jgi:CDP-diacylglycerol--glycerol-3-phosphate 3-phosphatidyltransferase
MTGFTLGGAGVVAATGLDALAGGAEGSVLVVTAGTAVGAVLGVIGTAQLGVSLRRALAD